MKNINVYFIIFISLISCNRNYEIDNFKLTYTNWYDSEGFMLKYIVNNDSLKIHYDCDFENCKDTIVYNEVLSKKEIYKFYKKIKELKIDTLKKFYEGEYVHGTEIFEIEGDSLISKKVLFIGGYYHPVIEEITIEIDKLLSNKKYLIRGD